DPESSKVTFHEGPAEEKQADKGGAADIQAIIEDEPEERIKVEGGTTYDIKDEKEEYAKGAGESGKGKVEVQVKNAAEEVTGGGGKTVGPVDPQPRLRYQYGLDMRFGIFAMRDSRGAPLNKRITYALDGWSSNTRVKIDGADRNYGPSGVW